MKYPWIAIYSIPFNFHNDISASQTYPFPGLPPPSYPEPIIVLQISQSAMKNSIERRLRSGVMHARKRNISDRSHSFSFPSRLFPGFYSRSEPFPPDNLPRHIHIFCQRHEEVSQGLQFSHSSHRLIFRRSLVCAICRSPYWIITAGIFVVYWKNGGLFSGSRHIIFDERCFKLPGFSRKNKTQTTTLFRKFSMIFWHNWESLICNKHCCKSMKHIRRRRPINLSPHPKNPFSSFHRTRIHDKTSICYFVSRSRQSGWVKTVALLFEKFISRNMSCAKDV